MAIALTPGRIRAARIVAVVADLIQLGGFEVFIFGAPGGFDAVLDVTVGIAMVALLGWNWAFLPGFVSEALPIVDLFPTWTLAALWVTRGGAPSAGAAVTPVEPAGKITDLEAK